VLPFVRKVVGETRVGDLPLRPIPVIAMRLSMAAAREIAALKRTALLLVESDDLLVGVIDERPLATAGNDVGVADVMKPLGVCLHPAMAIARARDVFLAERAPILPVVAGGFVIGAITRGEVEAELRSGRRPASDGGAPRFADRSRAPASISRLAAFGQRG
jgi:CBS domain-containing protein